MYLFPRVFLSEKAIRAAEAKGLAPDTFYCLELLEDTGLVG
jgi:alanine transaminase